MTDRIDYLRVAFRGDAESVFAWKSGWTERMEPYCTERGLQMKAVCDFSKFYDAAQAGWVDSFECWGKAADYAFDVLPVVQRPSITRIDYRVEMERPKVGIATVYHLVERNKGKSRRTITKISSPSRTKKGGRDAGGDFLAVGSRESERRSSYYQRSGEPWALEVQFGKGYPAKIHREAVDLYLNTPGLPYADAYRKVAYHHFSEAIRDHFYLSHDQIAGRASDDENEQAVTFQESLLSDFDLLWQQSDEIAKVVITEKVIAERERRAIIAEYEIEEPPDLWL